MPSQVRIISARNSREWDTLVEQLAQQPGVEHCYGGCATQQRADEVRRKIRTAAKRTGELGAKVYWKPCDNPGRCKFGSDCQFHTYATFYPLDVARQYKAQQAAKAR